MKTLFCILAVAFMFFAAAGDARSFPVGADLLNHFEKLPEPRLPSIVKQVSSHDRTGLNDDGFTGLASFLYIDDEGRFVLFDEEGPGVINDFWFTNLSTSRVLQIFVDGEEYAVVDTALNLIFTANEAPFVFPLAGDDNVSSGGFYSYVPIPFRKGCKIATTGPSHFYHITYELFSSPNGVESFTGDENLAAAINNWNDAGTDPKNTDDVEYSSGSASLIAMDSVILLDREGSGEIASIRLRPDAADDDLLRSVSLRIRFDGAEEPQVDVPFGIFFLADRPEAAPRSLPLGIDEDGWYYCFFPMPFWKSAQFELLGSGAVFDYEIGVSDTPRDIHEGHFYAKAASATTEIFHDYLLLAAEGRGHYVGTVMTMKGYRGRGYLEGDERVYTDGSNSPALYGTGTEDYFQGGWYFNRGVFTLPTHGYVSHRESTESDETAVYRLHFADPLPFMNGIRFGIEHDMFDCFDGDDYRSASFWYGAPDPAIALDAEIDPGNIESETDFEYAATDAAPTGTLTAYYEGDFDLVPVTDEGYAVSGASSFKVPINPYNAGLLLRRRMDAESVNQKAMVFADGEEVGPWETRGGNIFKRWSDENFLVPAEFTAGKTEIVFSFENENENFPWTEYRWQVFSVLTPIPSRIDAIEITGPTQAQKDETVVFHAMGTYWDGTSEEISGQTEWIVSGPADHAMRFGYFTPKACGLYRISALANSFVSTAIDVDVPCDDDEQDDTTGPDDDETDDASDDAPALSDDDDNDDSACCG